MKKFFVLLIAHMAYPQEFTQQLEELKNHVEEFQKYYDDDVERSEELTKKLQDLDSKRPPVNIGPLLQTYKDESQNSEQKHILHQDQKKSGMWNSCVVFIKDRYKFYMGMLACYFIWMAIVDRVIDSARYLTQPNLWSSWRSDLTFNEILAFPREIITPWLVNDIFAQYQDNNPIQSFYSDLKVEEKHLRKLLKFYQTPTPFSWFIPVVLFQSVPNRLKVLEHLKGLVIYWELEQARAALCKE